jgi:hypothetical protein
LRILHRSRQKEQLLFLCGDDYARAGGKRSASGGLDRDEQMFRREDGLLIRCDLCAADQVKLAQSGIGLERLGPPLLPEKQTSEMGQDTQRDPQHRLISMSDA